MMPSISFIYSYYIHFASLSFPTVCAEAGIYTGPRLFCFFFHHWSLSLSLALILSSPPTPVKTLHTVLPSQSQEDCGKRNLIGLGVEWRIRAIDREEVKGGNIHTYICIIVTSVLVVLFKSNMTPYSF